MPRGDGTGPWGQGAGTGWGRGGCVPYGRGVGFGRGRGLFGRAFGAVRNIFASNSQVDEEQALKAERESIDARLAQIEKEKK